MKNLRWVRALYTLTFIATLLVVMFIGATIGIVIGRVLAFFFL